MLPKSFDRKEFESKGFYKRTFMQDFHIVRKVVYLGIRHRRWRSKADKSFKINNDCTFITE